MKPTHLELAKISRIAYCEPTVAIPAYKEMGLSVEEFRHKSHVQYYKLMNDTHIVYAIRGTNVPRDWLQNFMIERIGTAFGRIHKGFSLAADEVTLNYMEPKQIVVTGHSKGASVALLLSLYYGVEAVTFGGTMIGKVDEIAVNATRYVNNMDIVPRVPGGVLGYKHVGEQIYFNYYGEVCRPTRWQVFIDRMRSRYKAIKKKQKFDDFYDHKMEEYIEKLELNNL